jgi:hypothetical protein
MRLDHDLVRALLIEAEETPAGGSLCRKWTREENETLLVLEEAGFILVLQVETNSGPRVDSVLRLRFEGHEFLKNVRDDAVYQELKNRWTSKLRDISISVFAQIAAEYTKALASS